ncbi:lectin C-type domain protein, partial [Cooperia oncophora]
LSDLQVFREEATFDEAERRCVSFGGHLASIHSDEENEFVYGLATRGRPVKDVHELTWIGLRKHPWPKDWLWTWTDRSPSLYTRWSPKQPDNSEYKVAAAVDQRKHEPPQHEGKVLE